MKGINRKKFVQRYYSKRAKEYDQQKARTWKSRQGFSAKILSKITSDLKNFGNKKVLEVGVGSGRIGFSLMKKVKPWFIGLDVSKEMLNLAKKKMKLHKQNFDLILGDADHLPFINSIFDAIVCISTMHYFHSPQKSITEFSRILKIEGIFVYGDLALHELDNKRFLDRLEKSISKAHAKYYKPSEMKKLLEKCGFIVSKTKVISYKKSFVALMEDKGKYFNIKPKVLNEIIHSATPQEKRQYAIRKNGLTLFYALITATKGDK